MEDGPFRKSRHFSCDSLASMIFYTRLSSFGFRIVAPLAILLSLCGRASAQSDFQPSWEIGISGSAMVTHSSPVIGTIDSNIGGGVFVGHGHHYIGGLTGVSVAFGGG